MKKQISIVIAGPRGAGKSQVAKLIADVLRRQGIAVVNLDDEPNQSTRKAGAVIRTTNVDAAILEELVR